MKAKSGMRVVWQFQFGDKCITLLLSSDEEL